MTLATLKLNASLPATKNSWTKDGDEAALVSQAGSRFGACQVHYLPDPQSAPHPGAAFVTHDDLLASLELGDEEIGVASKWFAQSFLADGPMTLKRIRLERGLSQEKLANAIGSKQSHISRIEKGTEDVTKSVMRKLRDALGIDMNTLDAALAAQEALLSRQREKHG